MSVFPTVHACVCVSVFTRQAVMTQWEAYALEHKKQGYKVRVPSADKVLTIVELKLDQKDKLQEIYRHPGENDVSSWTGHHYLLCVIHLDAIIVEETLTMNRTPP